MAFRRVVPEDNEASPTWKAPAPQKVSIPIDLIHDSYKKAVHGALRPELQTQQTKQPLQVTQSDRQNWQPDKAVELRSAMASAVAKIEFDAIAQSASNVLTWEWSMPPMWVRRPYGNYALDRQKHLSIMAEQAKPLSKLAADLFEQELWVLEPARAGQLAGQLHRHLADLFGDNIPKDLFGEAMNHAATMLQSEINDAELRNFVLTNLHNRIYGYTDSDGKKVPGILIVGFADESDELYQRMLPKNKTFALDNAKSGSGMTGLSYDSMVYGEWKLPKEMLTDQQKLLFDPEAAQRGEPDGMLSLEARRNGADAATLADAQKKVKDVLEKFETDEDGARVDLQHLQNWVSRNRPPEDQETGADTPNQRVARLLQSALDDVGRGFLVLPSPPSLRIQKSSVDLGESHPEQDAFNPNHFSAHVYFHVQLDVVQAAAAKKSKAVRDAISAYLARLGQEANAGADPVFPVTVKESGPGKKSGEFTLHLASDFTMNTPVGVNELRLVISVPSLLVSGAQPLPVYRLTAKFAEPPSWKPFNPKIAPSIPTPIPDPSRFYLRGRLGGEMLFNSGLESQSVRAPGPTNDYVGNQGHRQSQTVPSLQNLGYLFNYPDLQDPNNALQASYYLDKLQAARPSLDANLDALLRDAQSRQPLSLSAVDNVFASTQADLMRTHLGLSYNDIAGWGGPKIAGINDLVFLNMYYKKALDLSRNTPLETELGKAWSASKLKLVTSAIDLAFSTLAAADLATAFFFDAQEELRQSMQRRGFTLYSNLAIPNAELSFTASYSPTLRAPSLPGLGIEFQNALGLIGSFIYDIPVQDLPGRKLTFRIRVSGGALLPQGTRQQTYDAPTHDKLAAINSSVAANDWNGVLMGLDALSDLFGQHGDAGGQTLCQKARFYADPGLPSFNQGQLASALKSLSNHLYDAYSARPISDSHIRLGRYTVDNVSFQGRDTLPQGSTLAHPRLELFGEYVLKQRGAGGWLGELKTNGSITLDPPKGILIPLSTKFQPPDPYLSKDEVSQTMVGALPQFKGYLPVTTIRTLTEAEMFASLAMVRIPLVFGATAMTLKELGLELEVMPNLFGASSPSAIGGSYTLQSPFGGPMMPNIEAHFRQAFPSLLGGAYFNLSHAITYLPAGGTLSNTIFSFVADFNIFKGDADQRPDQSFGEYPQRITPKRSAGDNAPKW